MVIVNDSKSTRLVWASNWSYRRIKLPRCVVPQSCTTGKDCCAECNSARGWSFDSGEWTIIRQHPVVGERICARLKSLRFVLPITRPRHEKLDGSGYPNGGSIPVTALVLRIVEVYVDVYKAL